MLEPSKTHTNFHDIKANIKYKKLKCVYLNIRSLRKNFNNLLTSLNPIIDLIDIILLVETNITDEESNLYEIEGFNSIFKNRESRRGGGIAFYVKNTMSYDVIVEDTSAFESVIIKLTLDNTIFPILGLYRPPGLSNIKTFIADLQQLLNRNNFRKKLIILGDINIDLHRTNTDSNRYRDFISLNGLLSCNNQTTREDLTNNSATNIDHILMRLPNFSINAGVVTTKISDHFSLFFAIDPLSKSRTIKHSTERTTIIDNKQVNDLILKTDFKPILNSNNCNDIHI